jgi:hypothetical protein
MTIKRVSLHVIYESYSYMNYCGSLDVNMENDRRASTCYMTGWHLY